MKILKPSATSDYDRMAQAIEFIANRVPEQPTLSEVAAHVHLSPFHFQRLFRRWVGVSPKRFLQVLTVERAKELLSQSKPLLDVSESLGLSSGSRLYDHFVQLEAVTPGEYKKRGRGLTLDVGRHETPFGEALIVLTDRGICRLSFLDQESEQDCLKDLHETWPYARILENPQRSGPVIKKIFQRERSSNEPLYLHVTGTNFQINVWKALLQIAPAHVVSYKDIAVALGRPTAARAVGRAVAANPVAFIIPCHRVIQRCGKLGGYRWGPTRKQALCLWESAGIDS